MAAERSAFLAIVGRPNVGKSSLLNRMIGEKIAIVSKKPQTTRTRIMGVLTQGADQLVFLDTPGLVKPKNSLGDYMAKSVASAVAGVDACLLVTEAGAKISPADRDLARRFAELKLPAVLAINKIDLLKDKTPLMGQIGEFAQLYDFAAVVPVSAQAGDGMDELLDELKKLAQPGGHLFPPDTLTDQPERVIAAEVVREKVLRLLDQEVPHGGGGGHRVHEGPGRAAGAAGHPVLRAAQPQGHPHRQGRGHVEKDRKYGPGGPGGLLRLQGEPAAVGEGEGGLAPAPGDPAEPGFLLKRPGAVRLPSTNPAESLPHPVEKTKVFLS